MKSHYYISFVAWCLIQNRWSNKLVPPRQKTRKRFRSSNLKARSYHLHHDPVSKSSLERAIAIDHSVCSYENCQRLRSQCQSNLRTVLTHVVNIQSCIFGPQSAPNFINRYLHSEVSSLVLFRKMYQGQTAALQYLTPETDAFSRAVSGHKGSWYPAIVILLRMKF